MKALLLSAGYGTRLRPLTDSYPKCLLPINGKPLLFHWLDLLEKEKVTDVLINTHYLAEKIENCIKMRENKINITLFHEPILLGSAGTIFANKEYFKNEENFLLLYSDNLTNVTFADIIDFHKKQNSTFTTFIYKTDKPREKGIFEYDIDTGKVISFEEKPLYPKSNYANAGIGILNKKIFEYYSNVVPLDFGKNIMPLIIDNMYIMKTDKFIIDIGSIEDYNKALNFWEKL